MRKSVVVVIIVSTVLALAVGTALAEDKPDNKGDRQGHGHQKAANKQGHHKAANKGNGSGEARLANKTTLANNQATDTGGGTEQNGDTSYAFKGTIAQDGADGSPLEVKVEKANDAAQSFVGKNLKFDVSSDTESYLDNGDVGSSKLDAKLSDLKAGDRVLIQAKAPKNATGFTASLISAEASNNADTNAAGTNTAGAKPLVAK